MEIVVKLFGAEAALVGAAQVRVPLETGSITCGELRRRVGQFHPALAADLASRRFAVNHRFADDRQIVRPDDEVALIGFVSGG